VFINSKVQNKGGSVKLDLEEYIGGEKVEKFQQLPLDHKSQYQGKLSFTVKVTLIDQTKKELDPELLQGDQTQEQLESNSLTLDFSEVENNKGKEYEVGIGNMSPIGPVEGKNHFITSPFSRKDN
jgi:hypothetical protein